MDRIRTRHLLLPNTPAAFLTAVLSVPVPAQDLGPVLPADDAAPHSCLREPVRAGGGSLPDVADRVLFDRRDGGRLWAAGATYKASFGVDGFAYFPSFGPRAPRNYPVRFVLRAVRIAGEELPLAAAEPVLEGARVSFARGAVHERYDLRLDQVEQTFLIDDGRQGEIEIDIAVITELARDEAADGLQFGNAFGAVHYGDAHLVDGATLRELSTAFVSDTISIRVPAAARGPGPTVVDPIIRTSYVTFFGSGGAGQPDIAYDATSDHYLVVWQHPFSATDIDVWSEFRNGDGTSVPNSLRAMDLSALTYSNPRVANLEASDRFLVVMQRFDGASWQIYGRLRLVGSAPHPFDFPISDPSQPGNCINPDIGGDGGGGSRFLVAWQRELSATAVDIHARLVNADTSLAASRLLLTQNATATYPQVSQSNGNGSGGTPAWLVVYQSIGFHSSGDIRGSAVAPIGPAGAILTADASIESSQENDTVPSVSSAVTSPGGGVPSFLVTFERQNPPRAMAKVVSPALANQFVDETPLVDLTQVFGLGGFWVRAESDGCRFAVLSGNGNVTVTTFATGGGGLVMHDAPQALPGVPFYPRICSKQSGGGRRNDYGIVAVDSSRTPDALYVTAYEGRASGNGVRRRALACGGLVLDVVGRPYLGDRLDFSLQGAGTDIPGFAFGSTAPATNSLCSACPFGLQPSTFVALFGSSLAVPVPCRSSLIGVQASVQGFALGSGPCIARLHFSDAIDLTIQ